MLCNESGLVIAEVESGERAETLTRFLADARKTDRELATVKGQLAEAVEVLKALLFATRDGMVLPRDAVYVNARSFLAKVTK